MIDFLEHFNVWVEIVFQVTMFSNGKDADKCISSVEFQIELQLALLSLISVIVGRVIVIAK